MMDIDLITVGRMKNDELAAIANDYYERIRWPIKVHEITSGKEDATKRHAAEMQKILDKLDNHAFVVILDERGNGLKSLDFADTLQKLRDAGGDKVQFIIGGAEGLSDEVRNQASFLLSFGQQTWPHLLTRIMLLEQIYRAQTIIDGHPYHKQG
jgi:23S rRNA (pseudouridine1915-N3)-methyltransferase